MIKSELITRIMAKQKILSEKDIILGINNIIEYMCRSLSTGQRIEIRGFGSFSLRHRKPRRAHNPKTGDKVVTTSKYLPHFKPGKDMRERVNNAYLDTLANGKLEQQNEE